MKIRKIKTTAFVCAAAVTMALAGCGQSVGKVNVEEVKNEACDISYQGRQISGTYTGETVDGKKEGQGTFVGSDSEHRFQYDGEWKKDEIAGKGSLWDDQHVMHFLDKDRTGTYDGEVNYGEASGDGTFSAVNDDNVSYTYSGSFENGIFEGKGKLTYDAEDYFVQKGTFKDGEFDPDDKEMLIALGTGSTMPYQMTEQTGKFIDEHPELFPAASEDGCKEYLKDADDQLWEEPVLYQENLVKITGRKIGQVWNDTYWNHDVTTILTWDEDTGKTHYVIFPEKREDLKEGDAVTYCALPVAKSKYKGKTGGTHDCLVMYGSFLSAAGETDQ